MPAPSHTGHADEQFPTDTTDLEVATDPETVEIADGGAVDLRIAPVKKQLGDATVRMLAYNGSVPGPTLKGVRSIFNGPPVVVKLNCSVVLPPVSRMPLTFATPALNVSGLAGS